MAKTYKDGMDYFPHDVDASSDEKVEALRVLHGNDGYAFYFIMLERIYRTPGFEVAINERQVTVLANKVMVTPDKFRAMLEDALAVKCFDAATYAERQVLTSESIKRRAQIVIDKRTRMRRSEPAQPSLLPEYPEEFLNTYRLWNLQSVVVHTAPTERMLKAYQKARKSFTEEQIFAGIKNYGAVIQSPDNYWFSYKWTLDDFLSQANALPKFMTDVCFENFSKSKGRSIGSSVNRIGSRETITGDTVNAIAEAARSVAGKN